MGEEHLIGLHYGHLGDITYDKASQQWIATRALVRPAALVQLNGAKVVVETSPTSSSSSIEKVKPLHGKRSFTARLIAAYPEVQAAAAFLPQLLRNEEKENTHTRHETYKGELLAFGTAHNNTSSAQPRTVSVVAVIGGSCQDEVRLIEMRRARQGWGHVPATWLEVSELYAAGACCWQTGGGSVQQICFAADEDASYTLLAVRTMASVTILRPVWHDIASPDPGSRKSHVALQPHLDTQLLLRLTTEHLGKHACVDVAFRPGHQQQLATLNCRGHWALWEIKGGKDHNIRALGELVQDGMMDKECCNDEDSEMPTSGWKDGWGRVIWVGNLVTIVVCNRWYIQAFKVGQRQSLFKNYRVSDGDANSFIMDMKKKASNDDHFFIVTSTHLIWLRLKYLQTQGVSAEAQACFETLASWSHRRECGHECLRISFRAKHNGSASSSEQSASSADDTSSNVSILLYSREALLITEHYFSFSTATVDIPIMSGDSIGYHLPGKGYTSSKHQGNSYLKISDLIHLPISHGRHSAGDLATTQDSSEQPELDFFQSFVLYQDSTVSSSVYYCKLSTQNASGSFEESPSVPLFALDRKRSSKINKPRTKDRREENFVVDDDEIADSGVDEEQGRRSIRSRGSSETGHVLASHTCYRERNEAWSVPMQIVYKSVDTLVKQGEKELVAILAEIEQNIATRNDKLALHTVNMLSTGMAKVKNLDLASTALQSFFSSAAIVPQGSGFAFDVFVLASPKILGVDGMNDKLFGLTEMYKHVMNYWIEPLPSHIPGTARLARESIARNVAGRVCLASIGIQSHDNDHEEETSSWHIRPSRLSTPLDDVSGRTLPTPSPSIASDSGAGVSSSVNLAYDRLRRYARLTGSPVMPSKCVDRILTHWNPWQESTAHDFTTATTAMQSPGTLPGRNQHGSLLGKRQWQMGGLATGGNKRMRTNSQISMSQEEATSSQGALAWQLNQAAVAASQPTQGRFGGRFPLRLQKRKSGFR